MKDTSLSVVRLGTALQYLGLDSETMKDLVSKGLVDYTEFNDEKVLDLEKFNAIRGVLENLHPELEGLKSITVFELQNFCISNGFVENEKVFDKHLNLGLFSEYRLVHPFTKAVTYRFSVLRDIVSSIERGGISTLKTGGYTKLKLLEVLGITEQRFIELTLKLSIKPKVVNTTPVYSVDDYLSLKLLNSVTDSPLDWVDNNDEVTLFEYNGDNYIEKSSVQGYIGTKQSTFQYLNNIGVLRYREILHKNRVLTVVSKKDLDLIRALISKRYKPAEIALVLGGFLTENELSKYMSGNVLLHILKQIGFNVTKTKLLVEQLCQPDIVIQGVRLYRNKTVLAIIERYIRGTELISNISVDFILAQKLSILTDKTEKNIRAYAMKYLDVENDILRTRFGLCIRLSSYLKLQKSSDVEMKLNQEKELIKNKINFKLE